MAALMSARRPGERIVRRLSCSSRADWLKLLEYSSLRRTDGWSSMVAAGRRPGPSGRVNSGGAVEGIVVGGGGGGQGGSGRVSGAWASAGGGAPAPRPRNSGGGGGRGAGGPLGTAGS